MRSCVSSVFFKPRSARPFFLIRYTFGTCCIAALPDSFFCNFGRNLTGYRTIFLTTPATSTNSEIIAAVPTRKFDPVHGQTIPLDETLALQAKSSLLVAAMDALYPAIGTGS